MPNPGFQPNEAGYYRGPREGFPILSKLLGADVPLKDPSEKETAIENKENLRAMLTSCMPKEADSIEALKELLQKVPGLRVDPAERQKRHDLSVQARKVIVDAGVKIWSVNKEFDRTGINRNFRSLLILDDTEKGMEENQRINETMVNGTPEARGALLTQRVEEASEWLQRLMNNEVTDQELVENFEKIHMIQNLTANAEMLLKHVDGDDPAMKIDVNPEIREKLVFMERHSGKFALATDRVRMIASADYELLNLDYLLTADHRTYQKFEDYLGDEMDPDAPARSEMQKEIRTVITLPRECAAISRTVNLMEQVEKDFALEKDQATLQYVDKNGHLKSTTWDYKESGMERNFEKGYVTVTTPSGDAGCYRVEADGKVTRAAAKDMLSDLASEMKDVLDDVAQANKGFFIGSRAYSQAFRALKSASKSINDLGNPPDPAKMDAAKEKLERALEACDRYKGTKDPENFKNQREQRRYEAMDKAAAICRKQIALFGLQKTAVAAEKDAALNNYRAREDVELPEHRGKEVFPKISEKYSGLMTQKGVSSAIRESDVGNAADNLREDIFKTLNDILSPRKFNAEKARNVMADMVLLEVVKNGRYVEETENMRIIRAGGIEKNLAEYPNETRNAIRNNGQIKAITEHVTADTLRHFIMSDGAKKLADLMTKNAQQKEASSDQNALNQQMEKQGNSVQMV